MTNTALEKIKQTSKATLLAAALALVLAATMAVAAATAGAQTDAGEATDQATGEQTSVAAGEGQRLVGEPFNRTELYFGSEKPGKDVTKKQFDRFVDGEVTPKFPDGLTLLTGSGQFKESNGEIVEEKSFVLILLYPPDDRKANGEIQEIRNDYKRAFDQQSVLRVDSSERVSF